MIEASSPQSGLVVLHLFLKKTNNSNASLFLESLDNFMEADMNQVVTIALLGHKSDIALMALSKDVWELRSLQTAVSKAGFELADSYVSLTEVSEYAQGVPEEMKQQRLYPNLPPEGMNSWCFYPMSKRRTPEQNWYTTEFDKRLELMHGHGSSGRKFRGRVVQLITGSTGLDDYEWGVTLFGKHPDDLKDAVYTMRFDEASAIYAEFGWFCTGTVADPKDVLATVGVD